MQLNNKPGMFLNASGHIFKNARLLRRNMTEPEKILWEILKTYKAKGLKFRRQHPIHNFVADFYCHNKKLIIEIDGSSHNSVDAKNADEYRTQILNEHNIRVIRFSNEDVLLKIKEVVNRIDSELIK